MSAGHVYPWAYSMRSRADRPLQPFQMRDGYAAIPLLATLVGEKGYRWGGPIFNYPYKGTKIAYPFERPKIIDVDDTYLGENDLIVITTRPPINDWEVDDKKGHRRGFTSTEQKVFDALSKYLKWCTRVEVVLTDAAAATSPEVAARRSNVFRQNGGPTYRAYASETLDFVKVPLSDARTAVFLVYEKQAWPGGPGLLAAFGMGGTATMVWCHLLATTYRRYLCTTPFVMAEMRTRPLPERPPTMGFAEQWQVTILGPTDRPMNDDPLHVE